MAQITIDIPNNVLTRVVEALCEGLPEKTNAKAKAEVIRMIREKVAIYEANKAAREAFQSATTNAEGIILS